jgi:phospholipid/cholesterol/gamma-HCH transport system permease protein
VISQAAVTRLASLKRGPIVAALLHAAFQDVRDAKLPGDLRQVFRRAFVMLAGLASMTVGFIDLASYIDRPVDESDAETRCPLPRAGLRPAELSSFPHRQVRPRFPAMTDANPPVLIAQGIGHLARTFLREVGSVFWFIMNTFEEAFERIQHGRVPFRATSFFLHTERAGVDSVPLAGLVSFFLGLTMALLTGYQLQRFGTERLIPGLVAIGFTRELGPLLTGIMLAARIGAAYTAELGTMQVSEEVEAIEAMGIGPLRFLVAPRMLALVLLMPCLSTVSNIAAIFASSLVCKAYFSIAFPYFLDLVKDSLLIRDIITGILKSFLFGLLISAIACYRGLTVKGGAAGVGTSTTSSVVTAITAVIGFDTLYNVVYTTFYPT